MRQMVEKINLGLHTIESAMAKYAVRTRQTATKRLERVRQEELARTSAMKQAAPPTPTLVERVTQSADALASRVKQFNQDSNSLCRAMPVTDGAFC